MVLFGIDRGGFGVTYELIYLVILIRMKLVIEVLLRASFAWAL